MMLLRHVNFFDYGLSHIQYMILRHKVMTWSKQKLRFILVKLDFFLPHSLSLLGVKEENDRKKRKL